MCVGAPFPPSHTSLPSPPVLHPQPLKTEVSISEVPGLRVSTIIPANIACLEKAGAWADIEQHAAMFSHMQARTLM